MGNGNFYSAAFLLIGMLTWWTQNPQRIPTLSQRLSIPGASGPESLAFDPAGVGPYTGVSDGRIIKWNATLNSWVNFAVTTPNRSGCEGPHDHTQTEARCGRPLGLSSTRFPRKDYQKVISTGDNTGRLMEFNPKTKAVIVIADGLMFPNGVAVGGNGDFVLITETTNGRVLRYWLRSRKLAAGKIDVFTELPGNPDNIRGNKNGEFWVAMNAKSGGNSKYSGLGMAAKLDQNGKIVEVLLDKSGAVWRYASEVDEERKGEFLWIGSVIESAVVKLRV
ncbi:OLC1v1036590C1 [Oldenlandia corymbosa var. corymbosa]|uniref:OLC1v1036590C1 n=1 Tax=Oldenlandia corymbosa var. corymbosa TaxID=529605 RepID=A0AAV1CWB0_OLDCO|nr:OLC1v1036590C1 [Oldenlandia corymbosa var. corymbosa]